MRSLQIRKLAALCPVALALLVAAPAGAQQGTKPDASMASNQSNLDQKPRFMPPGMMMGPQSISADELGRLCDPRTAGFSGWRIAQLERELNLSEEQKRKLEDFKTASAKVLDDLVTGCPKTAPLTPTGRLEMMEQRLTGLLEAVKSLRVSFDPFYASLTDEQKAHLTADSSGRGWRWQAARGRDRK